MKRYYIAEIEFPYANDAGEEVTYTVAVSHYYKQDPDPRADSDVDFYGYEESEWDLMEDGKVIPTPDELVEPIEELISEYFEEQKHDY